MIMFSLKKVDNLRAREREEKRTTNSGLKIVRVSLKQTLERHLTTFGLLISVVPFGGIMKQKKRYIKKYGKKIFGIHGKR